MTTITYNGTVSSGGQTVNFTHPRELRGMYPAPPQQPLASYATELAAFQALLTSLASAADGGERRRLILEAQGLLQSNHMQAALADCPGGAPSASVKDAIKTHIFPNLGCYFAGAQASWLP